MLANIPPPPGQAFELGPLTIHFYAIAIAIGVVLGILLTRRRFAARGGDPDKVDVAALVAVLAGLLGARLGFVVWRLDRFADDPLAVFAIWQGGLVFFAGLLAGIAGAYLVARRTRMDLPAFADAAAPAIPLGQAIGRWGNYFNQELYGQATDLPWALEVEAPDGSVATHHPTFLYESLLNLVLVAVLLVVDRSRRLARGALIFAYLVGYGVIRFGVELLRIDTEFRLLGLSRNNWGFLALAIAGVVGLVWLQRRAPARERG